MRDPQRLPQSEIESTAVALREDILRMIHKAGSGHPGGSLSAIDIILTLYSGELRYDAKEPRWECAIVSCFQRAMVSQHFTRCWLKKALLEKINS